jgi:hypothetical protein
MEKWDDESDEYGMTRVLKLEICNGWILRWILPLNTEVQARKTWHGKKHDAMDTMTFVGWLKGIKRLSRLVQCRVSAD